MIGVQFSGAQRSFSARGVGGIDLAALVFPLRLALGHLSAPMAVYQTLVLRL